MIPIPMTARIASTLFLCLALPACVAKEEKTPKEPIPIKVKAVESSARSTLARFSGSLEPLARVDMAFRVGGYVEELGQVTGADGNKRVLEKGDFVEKGRILARLRASDYSQKVALARAQQGAAASESKLAQAELERARKLIDTGVISKAELDAAVARAESARADVESALARAGEAGVALADTALRAPMDGVVLDRSVEVGTLVGGGEPAFSIADTRTMKAVFAVPQALVEKLRLGSPLTVWFDAEGGRPTSLAARVTRIAPSADARGRVFAVEAELSNRTGSLRAGSLVSVHIPDATLAAAGVDVPLSSVVRAPGDARGFAVYVVEGDAARAKVRLQNVKLGAILGNSVRVNEGLRLGQRVVTLGATLLRDGSDAVVIP